MNGHTKEEFAGRERQLEAINNMSDKNLLLAYAYGCRDPNIDVGEILVKAVIESRLLTRISDQTKELETIMDLSRAEVKRLADSSVTVERLTVRLNGLTWVLVALTIVAILEPIGIEIWKAKHEPTAPQVVLGLPPHSSPQTPSLPAPQSHQ